jgi:hypothetical protein
MSQEEATALFRLRCIWQDRYLINYSGHVWRAARLGKFAQFDIKADSAEKLRGLIGEDYSQWQQEARRQQQ